MIGYRCSEKGIEKQVTGPRAQEPLILQASKGGGETAQDKKCQRRKREKSQSLGGLIQVGFGRRFGNPSPEEPSATGLNEKDNDGEDRERRTARTAPRNAGWEQVRIAILEESSFGVAFGEFINSSRSTPSLNSRRIWNQLTAATSTPRPRNTVLTWPAKVLL
jgi:hypothetical protein